MGIRRALLALVFLIALVAAGCGDDDSATSDGSGVTDEADDGSPPTDASDGSADEVESDGTADTTSDDATDTAEGGGGTLTIGVFAESSGLDPIIQSGTGLAGGIENTAIYDTIMRWDPETGEYEPRTAESLEPNDDFTEWTLKLRPGITFTDGTPYNAEAVVFNLERHVENNSRTASLLSSIESYDTPDDLTVVFTLSSPWSNFPFALSSAPGMIASPTAVAELGDELPTNPVGAGAGPFVIDSFKPNEAVTLTKNPDYWGGEVTVDELRFVFVAGAAATYENLVAGEFDMAFLRDAATIERAKADGYDGYEAIYSAGGTILMNNGVKVACQGGEPATVCEGVADGELVETESIASDPRIREAVAAAIDLDQINERVYGGAATMETGLLHSRSRWYNDIEGPSYDLERAQALVDEVTAEGDWDGSIRVACHNGSPEWATTVSALLQAAGFDVTVRDQRDVQANIAEVIVQKDFDLACWGSTISDVAPLFAMNRDLNSALNGRGGDYSGYVNPTVDEALAQARTATGDEKQELIDTIARAYADDIPFLSLGPTTDMIAFREGLGGVVPTVNTVIFLDEVTLG